MLIRKFIAIFFFSFCANAADLYQFDPYHTTITWSANHFGFSTVTGKFIGAEGKILIDEVNPQNSSLDVVVKISALDTGIPKFDEHLKGADFFDIEKFSTAKFQSKSVKLNGKNRAFISGDLTIHGVTQFVVLDVKLNKIGVGLMSQKKTLGFSATTKIKRSQFNILFGLPGVSDEVKLYIESEVILANSSI